MISDKMQDALNDQINAELYSSYLYLAMAAYFDDVGLGGFASWMKAQAQEEAFHAMKFFSYVSERGGRVELKAIQEPPKEWESSKAAFEASLEHERYVSKRINDLVNLAQEERDHATNNFLQWFVSEQVEEEDNVGQVVDKLKLMGEAPGGMFMLDRELGQRTFTPPAEESEGA
jgi:ferritin